MVYVSSKSRQETDLAVYELEDLNRDIMELVIHRPDNSLHSTLDCLHTRFQRTGLLLGRAIEAQKAKCGMNCCNLNKFEVLELLFLSCNLETQKQK